MISIICEDISLARLLYIIKNIIQIIQIVTPIILILSISIRLFNIVRDPLKEKDKKNIINSIIAAFIIFIIPILLNLVMGIIGEKTNFTSCYNNAKEISQEKNEYIKEENNKDKTYITKNYDIHGESTNNNKTFNLDHALQVGDNIHSKENRDLKWHGTTIGKTGGVMGAYTEAVNILNEKNYRIYEVYNVVVKYHPEGKNSSNNEPYGMNDVNKYFNLKVTYIPRTISSIKQALSQGKLVQTYSNNNKFRNSKGELVKWKGTHTGLIFYYDGEYFYMKNAGAIQQKKAIYTEKQLIEWLNINNISTKPIVYEKNN